MTKGPPTIELGNMNQHKIQQKRLGEETYTVLPTLSPHFAKLHELGAPKPYDNIVVSLDKDVRRHSTISLVSTAFMCSCQGSKSIAKPTTMKVWLLMLASSPQCSYAHALLLDILFFSYTWLYLLLPLNSKWPSMWNPHNECSQYTRFPLLKNTSLYHGKIKYPYQSHVSLVLLAIAQATSCGVVVRLIYSNMYATGVSTTTVTTANLVLENYQLGFL